MHHPFKKTKIIATIGPASDHEDTLKKLIDEGVNVVRLNFSHGTHDEHGIRIQKVRDIASTLDKPIAIIQDLQGPKIRLGNLQEEPLLLEKGQRVSLSYGEKQTDNIIPVQVDIFPYLHEAQHILINDGIIRLKVESIEHGIANTIVIAGGQIRSHKGVNLPDTTLPPMAITQKDMNDVVFGLKKQVDYIAISFVQSEQDIQNIRNLLKNEQHKPKIIAKIECALTIQNLKKIIDASDAVMVARGDLAVEIGQEEVPLMQRRIIQLCRTYAKPVIVATQMLESMIVNAEPTRAEVNDVATAVLDEVDAVMLSAESAQGNYPVEAVHIMDKIIRRIENHAMQLQHAQTQYENHHTQLHAIAFSSDMLANAIHAEIIFALTESGTTAIQLSRFRPKMPIISLSDNQLTCNQLSLVWGVKSVMLKKITNNEAAFSQGIQTAVTKGILKTGDKVVLVGGTNPGVSGYINTIQVETII